MGEELTNFLDNLFHEIYESIHDPADISMKIGLSIGLFFLWVASEWLLHKAWRKTNKDIKTIHLFHSASFLLVRGLAVLLLFSIWIQALDVLLILLICLVLLGLLAIKGGIDNLTGGVLILWRHYFRMYDRIEIDGIKGEVVGLNIFFFKVMELSHWFDAEAPTGRTIKIPNRSILTHPVYNYNEATPFVWKEIAYKVTFESDWEKALAIMTTIADENYQKFYQRFLSEETFREKIKIQLQLFDGEPEPKQLVSVDEDGISLKIRYIVFYKEGTKTETQLNQKILKAFQNEPTIQMAGQRINLKK